MPTTQSMLPSFYSFLFDPLDTDGCRPSLTHFIANFFLNTSNAHKFHILPYGGKIISSKEPEGLERRYTIKNFIYTVTQKCRKRILNGIIILKGISNFPKKIQLYWIKIFFELLFFPQFGDLDTLNSQPSKSNNSSLNCNFRLQKAQPTECVFLSHRQRCVGSRIVPVPCGIATDDSAPCFTSALLFFKTG